MGSMSDRISIKRRSLGISQTELAKRIGCSRQTVNMWERGHVKDLTGQHLRGLAKELSVEPAWILTGRSDQERSNSINVSDFDRTLCRRVHTLTEEERAKVMAFLDQLDEEQREVYELLRKRFEDEDV